MTALINVSCLLLIYCGYAYGLLDAGLQPTLEQKMDLLTQEVQQLKLAVNTLQNALPAPSIGPIAFTARLGSTIDVMGGHQHIVFDNALTNLGNAYSPQHGFFTAPVAGAYAFFVVITNIPQHSASIELMKDGQKIGHALAHGSSSNPGLFVTSTIAVTVHLTKGDQVWVQNEYAFTTVEELDGGGWSLFSGHLIATD